MFEFVQKLVSDQNSGDHHATEEGDNLSCISGFDIRMEFHKVEVGLDTNPNAQTNKNRDFTDY